MSGQIGSGGVRNLVDQVGSDQEVFKSCCSGRVGLSRPDSRVVPVARPVKSFGAIILHLLIDSSYLLTSKKSKESSAESA